MGCPANSERPPAYGDFLQLDRLLAVACVRDEADRTLFFAAHQACEIWFAVVLRHLESARAALERGDGIEAAEDLERLPHVMHVITEHFDVLGTLSPRSFDEIRATLGTSSGFQSAQYREIEFLCGAKDARYLNITGLTEGERSRLAGRLEQKSVSQAFTEYRSRVSGEAGADGAAHVERLRAALAAFDDSVRTWRERHARLAERFLGSAQGTAGSSGAAYLWRSAERSLFPEVFQLS